MFTEDFQVRCTELEISFGAGEMEVMLNTQPIFYQFRDSFLIGETVSNFTDFKTDKGEYVSGVLINTRCVRLCIQVGKSFLQNEVGYRDCWKHQKGRNKGLFHSRGIYTKLHDTICTCGSHFTISLLDFVVTGVYRLPLWMPLSHSSSSPPLNC